MFRKLSFVLIPLLIVTVLVLALPTAALADEGGPPDVVVQVDDDGEGDEIDIPTDPLNLIDYVFTLSVGVLVSAVTEWSIVKNWTWFRNLKPSIKFWVFLGLYLLFPCLGATWKMARHGFPEADKLVWAAYGDALLRGAIAWIGAITTHQATKAKAPTG